MRHDERPGGAGAAVKAGARRAAVHLGRAAKEVVAACGAFLDEVVRVKREGIDTDRERQPGPTRIDVE